LGYNAAPYPAAPANYYAGALTSGVPASADYSYGAYAPSAPASANTAYIRLVVPGNARVWIGGAATRKTGSVRDFESPELTPGQGYTYDVKVQWTEGGKEVTRTLRVGVSANATAVADLTRH
jgi:uncharacterized protein (TIGR03000 family)